jgi:glycosyltransferase involved in cell wall biosynthesis
MGSFLKRLKTGRQVEMADPKISIIVPTLNEEENIGFLLDSVDKQKQVSFEIVVVDGGSTDKTVPIARSYSAKVILEKGLHEFPSRNIGAKIAKGEILLFTCADVTFSPDLLAKISDKFRDQELVAVTGPGIPYDSSLAEIEYGLYNFARFLFSLFPGPNKRFSTSTNFLAVRKKCFDKTAGFISDVNADGIMGKQFSEMGKVKFFTSMKVFISPRRFMKMGFSKFNRHYLYVLENFFPFLSNTSFIKKLKNKSGSVHREMRAPSTLEANGTDL